MKTLASAQHLFSKILKKTDEHEGILILLCIQVLLRIPNLFEPYWYGDEAIYLTIGQGLRQGRVLYQEIIDHKTPLIYYFAMIAGNQLWFRIFLMIWMTGATWFFFAALKQLGFHKIQRFVATAIFIIFTTLPWLEGNIPNGELFVIGFMTASLWMLTKTDLIRQTFSLRKKTTKDKDKDWPIEQNYLLFGTGVVASLAFLTKVPALLDVAGLLVSFVIIFWLQNKWSLKHSKQIIVQTLIACFGFVIPIVLSFVYYFFRGAFTEYIDFAFLYSFRYAGNWIPPFQQPILIFLFSLKGKILVLLSTMGLLLLFRKKIHPLMQWITIWSIASLIGATLSLRPYPHYALQVVPPLAIVIGIFADQKRLRFSRELVVAILLLFVSISTFLLLAFRPYSTSKYYKNFLELATKQISYEEYEKRFNVYTIDNQTASAILQQSFSPVSFIWGTNPMLYAQSKTAPAGRFTVAFHIQDFPGAFDETMTDLQQEKPQFITVMNDESIEFPDFFIFLKKNYIPYRSLDHMTIYRLSKIPQLIEQ